MIENLLGIPTCKAKRERNKNQQSDTKPNHEKGVIIIAICENRNCGCQLFDTQAVKSVYRHLVCVRAGVSVPTTQLTDTCAVLSDFIIRHCD